MELEKRAVAAREDVARLCSLVKTEETKLVNLEDGVKVADLAISNVGNQAMQKAKLIASAKVEVGKWSILVAKA